MKEQIMYATKKDEPDYMEQVLTNNPAHFAKAKFWAEQNGYDRIRIKTIDLSTPPNFAKTVKH